MKLTKRDIVSIVLRIIVVACAVLGILSGNSSEFMSESHMMMFFTVQSNIWIASVCAVFLVLTVVGRLKGKPVIPQWLYAIKYMFTICITLTFLVFVLMLSGTLGLEYLLSANNLMLHFIVPLAAIADYAICDVEFVGKPRHVWLSIVMPLYYCIYVFLCVRAGRLFYNPQAADEVSDVVLAPGSGKVPYFFFDWEQLGWFRISEKGLGVALWIIILCAGLLGMGWLYLRINAARRKTVGLSQ